MKILSIGMVHPGPCGVRDYGTLLAQELRSNGNEVEEVWVANDGKSLVRTLRATWELLRAAFSHRSSDAAIWHYSVFAYSFRGIPMPGILAGMFLRLRCVQVVATLHEMALPWSTHGRRKLLAFCQHLVLPVVLRAATGIVVTTESRAAWLRSTFRIPSDRVHVIPVFSNFGEDAGSNTTVVAPGHLDASPIIAVPGWASSPGLESILLRAVGEPELGSRGLTIQLFGAPGPDSPAARRWRSAATAAGIDKPLSFTGVLSPEEFNRRLRLCDIVVLLFGDGPSSRHTMLAAAMANGCAIVALDGPDTWETLVESGAVVTAEPTHRDLGGQIARVLDSPEWRGRLGENALKFYRDEMSLRSASHAYVLLLNRVVPHHHPSQFCK